MIALREKEVKAAKINIDYGFKGMQLVLLAVGFYYLDGRYRMLSLKDNAASITQALLVNDGAVVGFVTRGEEKPKQVEIEDEGLEWQEESE